MRDQCSGFLDQTEELHVRLLDRLLRDRLGIELGQAERWDTPRLLRSDRLGRGLPGRRLLPGLEVDARRARDRPPAQRNVELDVEPRPTKYPRAFCAPIEVPGRVVLCIKPIGRRRRLADAVPRGRSHRALRAHAGAPSVRGAPARRQRRDGGLGVPARAPRLEPDWLSRRLDFGQPEEIAEESACILLFFVRRYCAKLLYELELHEAGDLSGMPGRYAELLTEATKIQALAGRLPRRRRPRLLLTSYLRAWALEAQLRTPPRRGVRQRLVREPEGRLPAARALERGSGPDADEIARELTGGRSISPPSPTGSARSVRSASARGVRVLPGTISACSTCRTHLGAATSSASATGRPTSCARSSTSRRS